MSISINNNHRLVRNGSLVERIASPASHTNGAFANTPSIAVIHFTFGSSGRSSANWFKDPANTAKSSAQVVVDRDGSVIQCVDFNVGANHAGASTWQGMNGLNNKSWGIELANWGYLTQSGSNWRSWTGETINNPVLARHKNGRRPEWPNGPIGWEPFSLAQIATAIEVVRAIKDKYGLAQIIGHDDISVGRKWDPGPAFDMQSFREAVFEGAASQGGNVLVVNSAEGLNLRRGPGTEFDVLVELANGTRVAPLEFDGNWVFVNVLGVGDVPQRSGWLRRSFLVDA